MPCAAHTGGRLATLFSIASADCHHTARLVSALSCGSPQPAAASTLPFPLVQPSAFSPTHAQSPSVGPCGFSGARMFVRAPSPFAPELLLRRTCRLSHSAPIPSSSRPSAPDPRRCSRSCKTRDNINYRAMHGFWPPYETFLVFTNVPALLIPAGMINRSNHHVSTIVHIITMCLLLV